MLRGYTPDDAVSLRVRVDDPHIAAMTLTIPHPYSLDDAREFIGGREAEFTDGAGVSWAMTRAADGELVGGFSATLRASDRRAELGYWVARDCWGQGYATEATLAVIGFAFETWDLVRVEAHHLDGNDASGRVMQKAGMTCEGTLRKWKVKDGVARDVVMYSVLADEWGARA